MHSFSACIPFRHAFLFGKFGLDFLPVGESNPDRPRDRRKYYAVILTGIFITRDKLKAVHFFCHADSAWECHAESAWEESSFSWMGRVFFLPCRIGMALPCRIGMGRIVCFVDGTRLFSAMPNRHGTPMPNRHGKNRLFSWMGRVFFLPCRIGMALPCRIGMARIVFFRGWEASFFCHAESAWQESSFFVDGLFLPCRKENEYNRSNAYQQKKR